MAKVIIPPDATLEQAVTRAREASAQNKGENGEGARDKIKKLINERLLVPLELFRLDPIFKVNAELTEEQVCFKGMRDTNGSDEIVCASAPLHVFLLFFSWFSFSPV